MYRVELKGRGEVALKPACPSFLMYRVELKVILGVISPLSPAKWFLMYRVELKAGC